jgi:hypothetical protein
VGGTKRSQDGEISQHSCGILLSPASPNWMAAATRQTWSLRPRTNLFGGYVLGGGGTHRHRVRPILPGQPADRSPQTATSGRHLETDWHPRKGQPTGAGVPPRAPERHLGRTAITVGQKIGESQGGPTKPHGLALELVYRAENRCESHGALAGAFPRPPRAESGREAAPKSVICGGWYQTVARMAKSHIIAAVFCCRWPRLTGWLQLHGRHGLCAQGRISLGATFWGGGVPTGTG